MKTVCALNSCVGCYACAEKCKKKAIKIHDDLLAYNAIIDENKCVNCGACESICPNNNQVDLHRPICWQEGWAEKNIRLNSSSGGVATAMMRYFVESGGFVAACLFEDGEFVFDITDNIKAIDRFAGSKYVKSNPKGIYSKVAEKLCAGRKVLFIGLPCQVAALKNFNATLSAEQIENLYTIDLICHGTPSPQILNLFLKENGYEIKKLGNIRFRDKTNFGLTLQDEHQEYKSVTPKAVQDMYTYAFLRSLDYTENCYSCRYASFSRISDVTVGDSWGSVLPADEQRKGVSLLLCQTNKGIKLVKDSGMQLKGVDIDKAIEANCQLKYPSIVPRERQIFFSNIHKGFHRAISKSVPGVYYKQKIKTLLVKMGIR